MEQILRFGARSLQVVVPPARRGAVILGYHLVGGGTAAPTDVPHDEFRRQMEWLRTQANVVALSGLVERLNLGQPLAALEVVLTFDDAFANFADRALPVLEELELPATLFVPVGFLNGGPSPLTGAESLSPLSWDRLRELSASGLVEVGSHGSRHVDLRALADAGLKAELEGSRKRLEDELGRRVDAFCYPRALVDDRVIDFARRYYRSAVAAGGRRVFSDVDPLRLPRFPVRRGLRGFESLLRARVYLEEIASDWARRRLRRIGVRRAGQVGSVPRDGARGGEISG